ncbi:Rieske 2Fe-2S domain-containing protein [Bacillus subtilis subsp. subtilis]|nr:Rieske 2Fe-2S domain-containing protein [Bacillus subtilis subsp. subtilis]
MPDSAPAAAPLATLDAIIDGGFAETEVTLDGDSESLVMYRSGSSVRGWLNICPHAGRRLDWAPGQFLKSREGHLVCAAHGASFSLEDGHCVAGPCKGDRLRAVALQVRDGQVWLG